MNRILTVFLLAVLALTLMGCLHRPKMRTYHYKYRGQPQPILMDAPQDHRTERGQ